MLTELAHRLSLALPPKLAHQLAVRVLAQGWPVAWRDFARTQGNADPSVTIAGLAFPNPVGLAAGFDKDAVALPGLVRMGFGHIEIGTVTPRPQAGNPGPALFRLKADRAIINRLGMPGHGADVVAGRLERWRVANSGPRVRIGVSVGSNRDSEDIAADMAFGVGRLGPLADYLTINLSSPNTAGLRDWQTGERLSRVLDAACAAHAALANRPPMFVKIACDMDEATEADLVDRVTTAGIEGLVLCNTTVARADTLRSPHAKQAGGLSGRPLAERALAQLRRVHAQAGNRLALIASGGVMSAADACARLEAGASLVQVMTGWIYRGPRLVDEILADVSAGQPAPVSAGFRQSRAPLHPDPVQS